MVQQHRDRFLADHRRAGTAIVVLDVPLLFETGGDSLCDHVIVVYARQETMQARALTRVGMTVKKFNAVVAAQMPVGDKLQRADLALDSDLLPDQTKQCLYDWLTTLGPPPVSTARQLITQEHSVKRVKCVRLSLIQKLPG